MGKMYKKFAFLALAFLWIMALLLSNALAASATSRYSHLSSVESEIVSRINGADIYNYDLELRNIALDHSLSLYSFRSSGSAGANETANWIQAQFESFGLDTHLEPFEFATWNLLAQPVLIIHTGGNLSTTDDQVTINSFQCEHYSWGTTDGGVNASLVTLPLPYDSIRWVAVNTTGKVLLMGGEVFLPSNAKRAYLAFMNKLEYETPAAIIFAWSSDIPVVLSPCGGRNFWNLGVSAGYSSIPVGWVSYGDGQLIRSIIKMAAENVSAFVSIRAVVGQGPHYNIVAKLPGSVEPQKIIIISGHYDSGVDPGFCGDGSGTSAVIELARVFSEAAHEGNYKPQYTLVFIAFAGEEIGRAGSVNYVKQHASELGNIIAVINLDSLGSEKTEISKTFPDDSGLDLQSVAISAGNDLGVTMGVTDPGGSDQETFRNPAATDYDFSSLWGVTSGIRNMTRVKSSIMITSSPLTWINTENDTSATLGWVTVDGLEIETRVAGLSVMRVLSTIFSPFLSELYGSVAAIGVVVVVAAYFERSRLRAILKGFAHAVLSFIGAKEALYIIVLTAIFLFSSFALHSRAGETEAIVQGYPTIIVIRYFGTPIEMFGFPSAEFAEGGPLLVTSTGGGVIILWGDLLASVAIFMSLAFAITYAVGKVRYLREISKG